MVEKIKKIFLGENKYRIVILSISLVLFVLFLLSKVLRFPENIGLCHNGGLCESNIFYGIWLPLHNSILYLLASTFLLLFSPKNTFKLWAKIMIPVFIVSLLIIITTPDICSGMICFDRTLVASGFAKLFLILTILIIVIKSVYNLFVRKTKMTV